MSFLCSLGSTRVVKTFMGGWRDGHYTCKEMAKIFYGGMMLFFGEMVLFFVRMAPLLNSSTALGINQFSNRVPANIILVASRIFCIKMMFNDTI